MCSSDLWFVAYAPYDHPRIVIAVLTEQGGFGAASAGPIVKTMLEEFFHVGAYAADTAAAAGDKAGTGGRAEERDGENSER